MGLQKKIEAYYEGKNPSLDAINWNRDDNEMADIYWEQGVRQFWLPEEFDISRDLPSWGTLSKDEQDTYKKVLSGLTGLDTKQSADGMSLITHHEPRPKFSAVFSFMDAMESIHAKSYSFIFTTLISNKETQYLLEDWVLNNKHLTVKEKYIGYFYDQLLQPNPSHLDRYLAKVASAFLESALFYSGFYYPLLLSGQGKMTQSGAIIYKITQDESYHGSAVGLSAQYDYELLTKEEQEYADKTTIDLLKVLYDNEVSYTHELYDKLGLTDDVIQYVQYNFNRALLNLGKEAYFDPKPFNPIVNNQVDVDKVRNVDFFSGKADYEKATHIKAIEKDDFDYTNDKENEVISDFL